MRRYSLRGELARVAGREKGLLAPRQDGEVCLWSDVEPLLAEVGRLSAWLAKIEGGDRPCTDEITLRRWAYEAVTLGHEAPE